MKGEEDGRPVQSAQIEEALMVTSSARPPKGLLMVVWFALGLGIAALGSAIHRYGPDAMPTNRRRARPTIRCLTEDLGLELPAGGRCSRPPLPQPGYVLPGEVSARSGS
jgi:hypothetical protein